MDTFDVEMFSEFGLRQVDLGDKSRRYRFKANGDTLKEAAERLNIVSVGQLSATLEVKRDSLATGFHVVGQVRAKVEQACVVSLVAVPQEIETDLHRHFVPMDRFEKLSDEQQDEVVVDMDATDELEPIEGDTLDFASAVLEAVALELDPYPRGPDVTFDDIVDPEAEAKTNPFAVLAKLKGPEAES